MSVSRVVSCARVYRVFSRPFHSALKRQLRAEKKAKDKETKLMQQADQVAAVWCNCVAGWRMCGGCCMQYSFLLVLTAV